MKKDSFTLFEVLISLIILSVAMGIVIKLSVFDNHIIIYNSLVDMDNQFIQNGKINNTAEIVFK